MYSLNQPQSEGVVDQSDVDQSFNVEASAESEQPELDLMYLVFVDGTTRTIQPQSTDD